MKAIYIGECLVCPYCKIALHHTQSRYFCADCMRSFGNVTLEEVRDGKA